MPSELQLGRISVERSGFRGEPGTTLHAHLNLWTPSGQPRHVELGKRDLLQLIKDASVTLGLLDDVRLT